MITAKGVILTRVAMKFPELDLAIKLLAGKIIVTLKCPLGASICVCIAAKARITHYRPRASIPGWT